MKTKSITKKGNTFYADFRNKSGKRIRKSLGKSLPHAKIILAQLMADHTIQNIQPEESTPKLKSMKILPALELFIDSWYSVKNALSRPKWHQWGERQAQDVMNMILRFKEHSGLTHLIAIKYTHLDRYLTERSRDVSASTHNKYIQHINRFWITVLIRIG